MNLCYLIFQENITEFPAPDVNSSMTDQQDSSVIWFRNSIHIIRWCFLPFIIVGTVTNIINIAIFSRPKMKSSSTGNFLLALAIVDLGIIYFQVCTSCTNVFLLLPFRQVHGTNYYRTNKGYS